MNQILEVNSNTHPALALTGINNIKDFQRFDVRIEDCLKIENTYVDILEDGFTKIDNILSYPSLYTN